MLSVVDVCQLTRQKGQRWFTNRWENELLLIPVNTSMTTAIEMEEYVGGGGGKWLPVFPFSATWWMDVTFCWVLDNFTITWLSEKGFLGRLFAQHLPNAWQPTFSGKHTSTSVWNTFLTFRFYEEKSPSCKTQLRYWRIWVTLVQYVIGKNLHGWFPSFFNILRTHQHYLGSSFLGYQDKFTFHPWVFQTDPHIYIHIHILLNVFIGRMNNCKGQLTVA